MTRRFEYTDAKSNKFWEVIVTGKQVTVRYGRIGTEGQTQVKAHAAPAEAKAAAEKLIAEKVRKGYTEVRGQTAKPVAPRKAVKTAAKGMERPRAGTATAPKEQPEDMAAILTFLKGGSVSSLVGLTSLSDEAAKALADYRGSAISLPGLTTLSETAAKALATSHFLASRNLFLDGLTTLSDAAAKALAGYEGPRLTLNGLTKLSERAAKALAGNKGWQFELNGLTTLSDAVATALAGYKRSLSLDGLTTLSDAAAKALAKHKGNALSLGGLTRISESVATALASHKGKTLYLDGVTTLSDASAAALASHKGTLSLHGLTTLSKSAAKALARHEGEVELSGWGNGDAVQVFKQYRSDETEDEDEEWED